jgi:hypothetical protein
MADVGYAGIALATIAWTLGSWVVLFALMYIVSPFLMKYGNQGSRVIYSAVYTLAFAIIIGLSMGGIMISLTRAFGMIPTLVIAFVIVLVLTIAQNYLLRELLRRGTLKMQRK